MGILKMFGDKPAPIKLHPQALEAHGKLVAAWALGAKVEVLNPNTGIFEACAEPVFDPELSYRVDYSYYIPVYDAAQLTQYGLYVKPEVKVEVVEKRVEVPVPMPDGTAPSDTTVGAVTSTPTPLSGHFPAGKFKRGDIWEDTNGYQYVVLADKRDVFADYNTSDDPDHKSVVVMRVCPDKKRAVTLRAFNGTCRKDATRNLVRKTGQYPLVDIDVYTRPVDTDGLLKIHNRSILGMKDVYLNRTTGELCFR